MIAQNHTQAVAAGGPRPSRDELTARVRALLPDLCSESPRFRTALLYLASRWTPNIDRLAAFAACNREFVAARARRWADRGLWAADPSAGDELDPYGLRYAVEVGEGRQWHPAVDPWAEAASAPVRAPAQGWTPVLEPHAGRPAHADASEQPTDSLPAPEIPAGDAGTGHDGDALLAALWAGLGLSTAKVPPEQRAA